MAADNATATYRWVVSTAEARGQHFAEAVLQPPADAYETLFAQAQTAGFIPAARTLPRTDNVIRISDGCLCSLTLPAAGAAFDSEPAVPLSAAWMAAALATQMMAVMLVPPGSLGPAMPSHAERLDGDGPLDACQAALDRLRTDGRMLWASARPLMLPPDSQR
ncbi:hypothetical protein [Streptomyces sp. NPDC059003]|uniref:hypothetical protein n=1 Tax=Streptomyces sp. NPDC059003 TaxID=3346691 RepID=UPI003673998C